MEKASVSSQHTTVYYMIIQFFLTFEKVKYNQLVGKKAFIMHQILYLGILFLREGPQICVNFSLIKICIQYIYKPLLIRDLTQASWG